MMLFWDGMRDRGGEVIKLLVGWSGCDELELFLVAWST
jgi:hypothetical protein